MEEERIITVEDAHTFSIDIEVKGEKKTVTGLLVDFRGKTDITGMKKYGIRHSDDDDMQPATVEKGNVWVNWFGDFYTDTEIDFGGQPFLEIKDWDWDF